MGTYATYDDTIHPTQADYLAEYCTACGNTGWVEYPVTLLEPEDDPCPHGCLDAQELVAQGEDYAVEHQALDQYLALTHEEIHISLEPEDEAIVAQARRGDKQVGAVDPLFTLLKEVLKHRSTPLPPVLEAVTHSGRVTSDDYIQGYMRDRRKGEHVSIPPYLVGTLQDYDDEYAEVVYHYFGTDITVYISTRTLLEDMRFAYTWDRSFFTRDLMGA